MLGIVHLYGIDALFEFPTVAFGSVDGAKRTSFVTDPPSDLQLEWNTSFTTVDSVEIVLVVIMEDTDELEDVAVLGQQANNGSYLVVSTALDEFDLGSNLISFKVRGQLPKRSSWLLYYCAN